MSTFLIDHALPDAGRPSDEEPGHAGRRSTAVFTGAAGAQWLRGYVTFDSGACVYIAPDVASLLGLAARTGIPADAVLDIHGVQDSTSGGA